MRGYVSCIAGCPYDGTVAPDEVAAMAEALIALGCYEISLGDTIGVGTAEQIRNLIKRVSARIPREKLAMHFHDTYGQGIANVLASLALAVAVAVPLGIAAHRLPRLAAPVMAVAGLLQTLPSLALLAFLIALVGRIGFNPLHRRIWMGQGTW